MLSYTAAPCCPKYLPIYRLGTKAEKMAGLIDFDTAFKKEVCKLPAHEANCDGL